MLFRARVLRARRRGPKGEDSEAARQQYLRISNPAARPLPSPPNPCSKFPHFGVTSSFSLEMSFFTVPVIRRIEGDSDLLTRCSGGSRGGGLNHAPPHHSAP